MSSTYSRDVAAAFSAAADTYDRFYSTRADRADSHSIYGRANRLWRQAGFRLFVDLGCGPGTAIPYLKLKPFHYLGVDVSTGMIRVARRRYPNHRFRIGDVTSFNSGGADVIFGGFAPLQHVEDLPAFAHQLRARLRAQGRFLVMAEPTGRPVRVLGPKVVTCPHTAAQARSAFSWAHGLRVYGHRRFTPGWLPVRLQRIMLAVEHRLPLNPDRCEWVVVEGHG